MQNREVSQNGESNLYLHNSACSFSTYCYIYVSVFSGYPTVTSIVQKGVYYIQVSCMEYSYKSILHKSFPIWRIHYQLRLANIAEEEIALENWIQKNL